MNGDGKCLGLAYLIGRAKREVFTYSKDRISEKTHDGKERLLSHGGKEISVFKLHVQVCVDLQAIIHKFWWKSMGDKKGIRSLGHCV